MVFCLHTSLTYSRCREAYERAFGCDPEHVVRFRSLFRYLPPAAHVLDLGCGPGYFGRLALDDSPHRRITGCDFAPEMIRSARQRVPEGRFYCRDVRDIPYETQRYEAIVASFLINHLTVPELAFLLPKWSEALAENGLLYLSFTAQKKPAFYQPDFADSPIYFSAHGLEEVLHLMQSRGIAFLQLDTGIQRLDASTPVKTYHLLGHSIN
jgi:predicted TPR repeat methyltransferase